ncbi:MAG: nodulation protein NfeD [Chloroflexota bacterium]
MFPALRHSGLPHRRSRLLPAAAGRVSALRLLVYLMLMSAGLLGLVAGHVVEPVQAQQETGKVVLVNVTGVINPTLAHYVTRSIDQAETEDAAAVVLHLDTPGGLDTSMRQIIQRILASDVPVVVYVGPPGARAASAGVYITYAAHVAAMAPNTNIGSATPVSMGEGGEQQMSPEMRAKVTNDASAYIRSLAEQRGRNAAWAEQAVREGVNITAQEALQQHVIDLVAADVPDLLRQLDGRTVETASGPVALKTSSASVQQVEMGTVDALLHALSDPTIAYLLISLGTMGIFLELSNPGSVLPGVSGGICLLLGFYALGALPVNYAGLLLMGFAFLLFVVDLFAPSHGVLTVGGLISFALGSLMLFNVPDAAPWIRLSMWTVAGVTGTLAAFFLVVARLVTRSHGLKPATGAEAMIGQIGRVKSALDPHGMVFVDGALWEARSDSGSVPAGARVEVTKLDGLRLRVRPVPGSALPAEAAHSTGVKTRP